jgi:tetratricopeptide (TPR) repeat protein
MSERSPVAVSPIVAEQRDRAIARGVEAELATALLRAGVCVTNRPESACYHLCGTLRGDGREHRLTFRLIEAATGRHLWAYQHGGSSKDIFLFEESAAASVAAAIQPGLRAAEVERARRKPDLDLTAQDLALRALPHVLAFDVDGNTRAFDLLGRAAERDQGHALTAALSSWCHAQRGVLHLSADASKHRAEAIRLAQQAIGLGEDATALAVLGHALALANNLDMAEQVTQRALAIDGSCVWAWARSRLLDVYQEHPDSGGERLLISLDLARDDPLAFMPLIGVGCAHFQTGRYAEAARWMGRGIAEHPSAVWAHQMLCPAYAIAGHKEKAAHSLAELRRLYPDLTISQVTAAFSHYPRSLLDGMANGLETAGLRL